MERRALIIGGGSRIGLAAARSLHAAGYDVIVAGRGKKNVEEATFAYIVIDVTDDASIEAAAKSAGHIDVFVANDDAAAVNGQSIVVDGGELTS